MQTLEQCATTCPIVQALPEETQRDLLQLHRMQCNERRLGQIGLLCGMPSGDSKDRLTQAALRASKRLSVMGTL